MPKNAFRHCWVVPGVQNQPSWEQMFYLVESSGYFWLKKGWGGTVIISACIKTLAPWNKNYDKPRQHIQSRNITLLTKICTVKAMVFPVVMYGCESWTIKKPKLSTNNWCLWTVVLEKTLESPLDSEEVKPVNPKGNQPWIFIGRTNAEDEAPVHWSRCEELTHWKRPCC